jgi:hypothetical protein
LIVPRLQGKGNAYKKMAIHLTAAGIPFFAFFLQSLSLCCPVSKKYGQGGRGSNISLLLLLMSRELSEEPGDNKDEA